jgi:predicted permease
MRISASFAIPLMLLLALGAAVNAASFGALYTLLWKPLPYADSQQLVELRMDLRDAGLQVGLSHVLYELLRADSGTFSGAAGAIPVRPLTDAAGRGWALQRVTVDFAEVLGSVPSHGRSLRDVDGVEHPLLLAETRARERFGSAEAALGQTLQLKDTLYTVVGVMPHGFSFPDAGVDAWTPYVQTAAEREQDARGGFGPFVVVARLAPGVDIARARASLASVLANAEVLARLRSSDAQVEADARSWRERYSAGHARAIGLLQIAALLLQGVVATNLANLLLFRVLARGREFAVRSALGARRLDLLRSVLAELWLPALLSTLAGCALAPAGNALLSRLGLLPANLPDAFGAPLIGPLVSLLSTALVLAVVVLSMLPALRPAGTGALREHARSGQIGRGRSGLLVAQIALATVLVGGAGLLLRSAQNLAAESRGFEADRVLLSTVDLQDLTAAATARGEADPEATLAAAGLRIGEQVAALPGVVDTAYADAAPFGSSHFIVDVRSPQGDADITVRSNGVSAGFFDVMGMPLLGGRGLSAGDSARGEVIVDALFVAQVFGGVDPVGRSIRIANDDGYREATVIGVVPTVKFRSLDEPSVQAALYEVLRAPSEIHFRLTRTRGAPADLVDGVRAAVLQAAPDAVLAYHRPLAEAVDASVAGRFALLQLVGLFALGVLLLSGLGLYAVLGLSVLERRPEFGVRLALGATGSRILGLVLNQGLRLLLPGVLLGVLVGIVAAGWLADDLFRVAPHDLAAWLLAALAIGVVALLACALPARRAARVSPRLAIDGG